MSADRSDLSWMVGQKLESVSLDAGAKTCIFGFEGGAHILALCPWRLLADGRISYTSEDHGQQFGLPAPVDVEALAREQLCGEHISAAELRPVSNDLILTFASGHLLEVLPMSGGYENWTVATPDGSTMIACGGGELAFFQQ